MPTELFRRRIIPSRRGKIISGRTSIARIDVRCRAALRLCLVVFSSAIACTPCLPAQAPPASNDLQVEAAFLYKFGAFVHWPNSATGNTFSICILGHDPFGQTLDSTLKGEAINGKPVVVARITTAEEASQCRIVFIGGTEEPHLAAILTVLDRYPVLTVSEIAGFSDRGGMIQFLVQNHRVRFDVNVTNAERCGLGVSSELLKVAYKVKHGEGRD